MSPWRPARKPRPPRARDQRYTYAERKRMRAAVEAWRDEHGDVCPGWQVPPHASTDLTAEHSVPVVWGGHGGNLTVLCRPCNSRRADARPRS